MTKVPHPDRPVDAAAAFAVPDDVMRAAIAPYVRRRYSPEDPAWAIDRAAAIGNRRLGFRRWLKRVLGGGRNSRPAVEVKSGYEKHWTQKDLLPAYLASLDERQLLVEWRGEGMSLAAQGIRRVHLLYLMRAIAAVDARSVLEVGCGNGNLVLTLAARFPSVRFAGVELTTSGVEIAQAMQAEERLPDIFADVSPEALVDMTAHRRVIIGVGNAAKLPFADVSFDLVYTRLALEQMESIRPQALAEIARVARKAAVMIEPWYDFNRGDPGRAYVRRQGYFTGRVAHLARLGLEAHLATDDLPQKVQFRAGPVVALRR